MIRRIALSALALPIVVALAIPAYAGDEGDFIARTNGARASHGLVSYAVRGDLTSVARGQAQRMASQHRLYHNPNLGSQVPNWRAVGENVGVGGTVSAIHNAFMRSSEHASNILSSMFTEVGIGTARGSDGQIYVSEVFRLPYGAAPARTVHRTVRRTTSSTASRTRRTTVHAAVPHRAVPKVTVRPLAERLRLAILRYRSTRVTGAFGHAMAYVQTTSLLGR